MSDEPSSSAAAAPWFAPEQSPADGIDIQHVMLSAAKIAERQKRNRELFNRKRMELLDDLIQNLDLLVFAELSTIYYVDPFMVSFLLRATVQFIFLTPKPSAFPFHPKSESFVGAILGSNFLCILLHIFFKAPSAGEATRGYIHGGWAIDFIGQKGPTSKLLLILLDVLVAVLQVVHLSAHVTRLRLQESASAVSTSAALRAFAPAQDLDSEERGVRRSAELEMQESIELQSLSRTGQATEAPNDSLFSSTAPRSDAFLFDAFKNGQIVLADLNPLKTVREQIVDFDKSPSDFRRSAFNAQLAGRLMGIGLARGRRLG